MFFLLFLFVFVRKLCCSPGLYGNNRIANAYIHGGRILGRAKRHPSGCRAANPTEREVALYKCLYSMRSDSWTSQASPFGMPSDKSDRAAQPCPVGAMTEVASRFNGWFPRLSAAGVPLGTRPPRRDVAYLKARFFSSNDAFPAIEMAGYRCPMPRHHAATRRTPPARSDLPLGKERSRLRN